MSTVCHLLFHWLVCDVNHLSLLLQRECCPFSNGEYVKVGLAEVEHWIYEAGEEVGFLTVPRHSKATHANVMVNYCKFRIQLWLLYLIIWMAYSVCTALTRIFTCAVCWCVMGWAEVYPPSSGILGMFFLPYTLHSFIYFSLLSRVLVPCLAVHRLVNKLHRLWFWKRKSKYFS